MAHQSPAHFLIALALVEGIAGAIPILKETERTAGKARLYVVFDDGLLVFDGDILLVKLVIDGDTGIARDVVSFGQSGSPPDSSTYI